MNRTRLLSAGAISAFFAAYALPVAAEICYEGCEPPPEECVSGCGEPPSDPGKGNNGWGNGADSTNAGSFSGKTSVTKDNNGLNQPRLGPVPAVQERFSGR